MSHVIVMTFSVNSSLATSSIRTLTHLHSPRWRVQSFQSTILDNPTGPLVSCSFRPRRRRPRRRLTPNTITHLEPSLPSDSKLQVVIDVEDLKSEASLSIKKFLCSFELRLYQFVYSGNEALKDLQTLITVDSDRRVVLSCQRSTLLFLGNLVLCGCVIAFVFKVLVKLGLGFREKLEFRDTGGLIRRRDRGLGGKEVVVGTKKKHKMNEFKVLTNPPSPFQGTVARGLDATSKSRVRWEQKLPDWWPVSLSPPFVTINKHEYQREANRLVRAIMDNRMNGKDISEDDIIQLRQICRTSGVTVCIDTTNSRDSIYRVSVDFVLNNCNSVASHSSFIQIYGEDARQFIAGLAYNIGLENIRAARIVSAAVAARTRSYLLQAWALEMQGKHSEAVVELSKICLIHQIFPPEECSPEMEMVARGLEKHLKLEQREFLMNMLVRVCGEESHRSVAEALGVMIPRDLGNQQGNKFA